MQRRSASAALCYRRTRLQRIHFSQLCFGNSVPRLVHRTSIFTNFVNCTWLAFRPARSSRAELERGQNIVENRRGGRPAPTTVNSSVRTREYLTTAEIERLMAAARKSSRYGHRDATMILISYRHGLRASELCDLQWSQVELASGRLHVRRAKNGSPSVHPMQGEEMRALR